MGNGTGICLLVPVEMILHEGLTLVNIVLTHSHIKRSESGRGQCATVIMHLPMLGPTPPQPPPPGTHGEMY